MACATVDTPVILVEGTKEAPAMRHFRGGSSAGNANGKRSSPPRGRKNSNGYTQNNGNKFQVQSNNNNNNNYSNSSNSNKNNNNSNINTNKYGQKNGGYYKNRNGSGSARQYNKQSSKNSSNRQSSLGKEEVAEASAVAAAAVAAVTSAVAKAAKKDNAPKSNKKVVEVASYKKDNRKEVVTKKALDEINGKSGGNRKSSNSVASDESESYKSQQELHERFEPVKRELPKITPRSAQSALASFFWNHSVLFQGLEHAKIVGWESNELDTVFSKIPTVKSGGVCSRSNSMPSLGSQRMNLIPGSVKPSPQRLTGNNNSSNNTKLNKNTAEMRFIMQAVMKELDGAVDGCLTEAVAEGGTFFDVCAAPGGFSAYLLESAPEATGMGVTLSPDKGGHAMAIPNSSRYWCRHADVLEDPSEILFCKPSHKAPYVPVEFQNIPMDSEGTSSAAGGFNVDRFFSSAGQTCPKPHLCDLVILDGHYLNGNNSKPLLDRSQSLDITSEIMAPPACSLMNLVSKETEHATKSMWISQFIIAVQNLKQGGTLVFRSSTKPDLVQIAMLCLVARLFKGKIRPVKPTVCHMMRSSFYVVCQGFDLQTCAQLQVFPKMLFLWSQMKQKDPGSLPIWHPIDKLSEFTTPDNFINTWGPALINFFEPIWKFQTLALNAMIQDCSTNSPRSPKSNGCKSKMCFYHKLGQCKRGNGQCWYAHETDELHPEIRKACGVRFRPLVSPWFPPNTNKII